MQLIMSKNSRISPKFWRLHVAAESALVKGTRGVGLGFSCQDLLTRFETVKDSSLGQETFKKQ